MAPRRSKERRAAHSSRGNGSSPAAAATSTDSLSGAERAVLGLRSAAVEFERVARAQFAAQHGKGFYADGAYKRDDYVALGYERNLGLAHYRAAYERGDICERIVEAFPRATWTSAADIREVKEGEQEGDADREPTRFETEATTLFRRLNLWSRLMRADILAGLGEYAILIIGAPGEPKEPLPKLGGQKGVLYVTPLSQRDAEFGTRVKKTDDPRFGKPEFYKCKLADDRSVEFHWSRVIHLAEGSLENDLLGKPRLRAVFNRIYDLDKILGGGAEAAWNRAKPGMHFNVSDPEAEFDTDDRARFQEQVEAYEHKLSRNIRTQGIDVTLLSAPVQVFKENADAILDVIAGTTGIPKRLLIGSERGELASSQDRENWADRVTERRREFAVPLVAALVERLIESKALPAVESFEVVWPEEDTLTEAEKTALVSNIASANAKQKVAGDTPVMTSGEMRKRWFNLEPLPEPELDEELPGEEGDEGEGEPGAEGEGDEEGEEKPGGLAGLAAATEGVRLIQRAADRNRMRVVRVILAFFTATAAAVDAQELERAFDTGNRDRANRAVEAALSAKAPDYQVLMEARIAATMYDAASASLQAARKRGSWHLRGAARAEPRAAVFQGDFATTNPRALEFARLQSSKLITEVSDSVREAIRQLVARGFAEGISSAKLAQLVRQHIGLRSDQIATLERFAARPLRNGKLPTSAQVARYRERLLNQRARLIARTETMRSANEGQRELWRQAVERRDLPANQKRVWTDSGDEDVRDEHHELNGQVRGLDEPFVVPSTGRSLEPGQDPNCRCGQGLATEEDLKRDREKNGGKDAKPPAAPVAPPPPIPTAKPGPPLPITQAFRSADLDALPANAVRIRTSAEVQQEVGYSVLSKAAERERLMEQLCADFGFDKKNFAMDGGMSFTLNGRQCRSAGSFNPMSETIRITKKRGMSLIDNDMTTMTHELTHHVYNRALIRGRGAAAHDLQLAIKNRARLALESEDGITSYSTEYWRVYQRTGREGDFNLAVNETLAELTTIINGSQKALKPVAPVWTDLWETMFRLYTHVEGKVA